MEEKVQNPSLIQEHETSKKGTSKKKITIEVDEDDSCLKKNNIYEKELQKEEFRYSPGSDPRYT